MKIKLPYLIISVLTVLLSWFLGYIKFPYISAGNDFCFGLLTGILLIVLVFLVFYFLGKINLQLLFSGGDSAGKMNVASSPVWNRILISILVILLALSGYTAYDIYKSKIKCVQGLEAELEELRYQAGLEDQGDKTGLFLNILGALDSLRFHTKDTVEYQRRLQLIISMSSSYKVHKQWDPEYKNYRELSWKRGMLLLAFLNANLDSASFQKVKDRVSFSGADLRNADLSYRNLKGIDLSYADLEQANLEATQFDYAKLKSANLAGANLNKASFIESNLISTRFNWAKVNEVNMFYARLDSADFSNASIIKSYLKYATSIHTVMRYALLKESDLSNGFFIGTDFSYANLTKTNLKDPDFRNAKFHETILDDAIVQDGWMEKLTKEMNEGIQEIFKKYNIVQDSTTIKDSVIFRISLKPA